jgi:serine/threonine protein kinase
MRNCPTEGAVSTGISRNPTARSDEPRPTLQYGERLGRYIINGFAGTGATSFVYRARREDSFEPVAIKVLHPHLMNDDVKRKRFLREAQMMMALRHPNIVQFHEIMELEDEGLAFVMEFIEGETLEGWTNAGAVDEPTLACLFVDLLRGLGQAHRVGIVHRDLKPANVMITEEHGRYVAKIIDFGVARFSQSPTEPEDRTKIVGTAAYISPEEVRDPDTVCEASDIYSVGVMMYEAACGRRPFEGLAIRDLMQAHAETVPASPRSHNPDLTSGFERVILRTLSKSPEGRFRSARELIVALEHAMHEDPSEVLSSEALTDIQTQEWSRALDVLPLDPDERAQSLAFIDYFRTYLMFALTFVMSTGVRGDGADPHYLSRNDSSLPYS